MKLLALDSSGMVASVAIVTEEGLLAEYTVDYKKTHSQTLLPMLDILTKMVELDLASVDGIVVAAGPGSFTGLRIGSATAKGLGLALDKPIIGVPTLEGLAYNLFGTDKLICPMIDARRNQVYTGLYECAENGLRVLTQQKAVPVAEIIEEINSLGREVIFLGDAVSVYRELIVKSIKVGFAFAPVHLCKQRAGAVGALGIQYFKQNRMETAAEHEPIYLRVSQAERERAERLQC